MLSGGDSVGRARRTHSFLFRGVCKEVRSTWIFSFVVFINCADDALHRFLLMMMMSLSPPVTRWALALEYRGVLFMVGGGDEFCRSCRILSFLREELNIYSWLKPSSTQSVWNAVFSACSSLILNVIRSWRSIKAIKRGEDQSKQPEGANLELGWHLLTWWACAGASALVLMGLA